MTLNIHKLHHLVKGTLLGVILLQIFFLIIFPRNPDQAVREKSRFFWKFAKVLTIQHYRMEKNFTQKAFAYLQPEV
jgi:hypothetical protein